MNDDDRLVQPRQIYASTLTRRDRRWSGRRGRGLLGLVLVGATMLALALTVLVAVVFGVT